MYDNEAIPLSMDVDIKGECKLGENVKCTGKVVIGDGSIIEDNCILGYSNLTKVRKGYKPEPTIIGKSVHIRSGTVIYAGCKLGNNVHIGHNTILREFTEIGDHSSIGSLVMCEGYTKIGHHTTIHSQCHLTAKMNVGNYVFFGPNVTTANDRKIRYYRPNVTLPDQGPRVDDGAVIGAGACILPYVHVEMGGFVAAGAVVTKKVKKFTLVIGIPAKEWRHVNDDEVVEVDYIRNEYVKFIAETYGMTEEY